MIARIKFIFQYMAEEIYNKLQKLCESSFDFGPQNRLLRVATKAKYQTPLLAEDGISFIEKWTENCAPIPLSVFAPIGEQFSAEEQANLFADFRYALRTLDDSTGFQNAFLAIGFLRTQNTAPLLLVPVNIDPASLNVTLVPSAPIENIPLRLKNKDFVELPSARPFWDGKVFHIRKYFAAVERAVDAVVGWKSTGRGLFIGFYDAASLYAYGDSETWKQTDSQLLPQLLSEEGFRMVESDVDATDETIDPAEHHFVKTLDSSACTALIESLSPANPLFAIEAAPGASKEEFLANFTSECIANGKKILLTYKKKASLVRFQKIWNPQVPEFKDTTLEKARESLKKARKILMDYNRAVNLPIAPGSASLAEALIALGKSGSRKKYWPDSTFKGAESLDKESFHQAKSLLQDFLEILHRDEAKTAIEAFSGVSLESLNNTAHIRELLEKTKSEYGTLSTLAESVSNAFFFDRDIDVAALSDISIAITPEFDDSTPSFDGWNLESKDWETYEDALRALPQAGASWSDFRRNGSPIYADGAIDMQLGAAREILNSHRNKTFKAFSEYYHDAKKTLLHAIKNPKSIKSDQELLDLADKLIELQDNKKLYTNSSVMAGRLFGKDWDFEHTNWDVLKSKLEWFYQFRQKNKKNEKAALSYAILAKYSQIKDKIQDAKALKALCESAKDDFDTLCRDLAFSSAEDFESVEDRYALLQKWESAYSLLPLYVQIQAKRCEFQKLGLNALEKAAIESHPDKDFLESELSRFWYSLQVQQACKIFPDLFSSSPRAHTQRARDFRDATDDLCLMNLRNAQTALQKNPKQFTILPLAETAARLSPKDSPFDVAIFLDAEAISPIQALPAILRSQRTLLIGDSNLPTPPFPELSGSSEHSNFTLPQFESILALALHKGAPHSFLSLNISHRNPLLIDFANREFYNQKIHKLPSPDTNESTSVRILHSQDLSRQIAEEAARHVEQHPMQSLGIIVFTEERRQSVFQAIREKIQSHPDLAYFLSPKDILRDPYVKLPEEASGDYRDTLFICAEPTTTIAAQGLNTKQINVCASHALSGLRIFTAEKIENTASPNPGIRAYVDFLHFVENASTTSVCQSNPLLSPFEEQVFKAIQSDNLKIERNWGYNGTEISFAVHDANNPDRLLLGIDTDSNGGFLRTTVEDRHYLRPKLLLDHIGWKIIPLWCPNWFRSTADERDHILTTIAVEQSVAPPPKDISVSEEIPDIRVEPYKIVRPKIEGTVHDVPIPELSPKLLVLQMKFYVDAESPIHEKNLIRRVLHLHGLHRAGPVVVRAIKEALSLGLERKTFAKTGAFFYSMSPKSIVLRDRSALPDEERKLIYVSPEEKDLFPPGTDERTIRETLGLL